MTNKAVVLAVMFATAAALTGVAAVPSAHVEKAEKHEEHESAGKVTGKMLKNVKTTLEQGLMAGAMTGKPISGKFELNDGKLQLSVYTMKAEKFFEVLIDQNSGKAAKSDEITGGEDLAAAIAQSEALAKAKATTSLRVTVRKALAGNKGFSAISVMPSIKNGHPVAEVTIGMEDDIKTVQMKLD